MKGDASALCRHSRTSRTSRISRCGARRIDRCPPTRQVLFGLLWTRLLRALAPETGVSDATLRKAATRMGLPILSLGHKDEGGGWPDVGGQARAAPRPAPARPTTSSSAARSGRIIRTGNDRPPCSRRRRRPSTNAFPTAPRAAVVVIVRTQGDIVMPAQIANAITFQQVCDTLESANETSPDRRARLRSAVVQFCELSGLAPTAIANGSTVGASRGRGFVAICRIEQGVMGGPQVARRRSADLGQRHRPSSPFVQSEPRMGSFADRLRRQSAPRTERVRRLVLGSGHRAK